MKLLSLCVLISFPVTGFSSDNFCDSKTAKKHFLIDFEDQKNEQKEKAEARMQGHKELVAEMKVAYSGRAEWFKDAKVSSAQKKAILSKMIDNLSYMVKNSKRDSSGRVNNYFVNNRESSFYFPLKLIGGEENYKRTRGYELVAKHPPTNKDFYRDLSRGKEFNDPDALLLTIKKNLDHMIEEADKKAQAYLELPASASVLVGDLCQKNTPVEKITSEVQAFCLRYGDSDCREIELILDVYADATSEKGKCEDPNTISGISRSTVKGVENLMEPLKKINSGKEK